MIYAYIRMFFFSLVLSFLFVVKYRNIYKGSVFIDKYMEYKRRINLTMNNNLVNEAKRMGINISEASEKGLLNALHKQINIDDGEFPEELAESNPDEYWINPQGRCVKRGAGQYFIQYHGNAPIEVDKKTYLKWLGYYVKDGREEKVGEGNAQ